LKDIIVRYKSITGSSIKLQPGWDCHGLPIETKALKSIENGSLSPLEIRKLCRNFAEMAMKNQLKTMKEWGLLVDYDNPYLTMNNLYEFDQLCVLKALVEKGLIYSAEKPVYYSPSSKTCLADSELEYLEDFRNLDALVKFKFSTV
jgi:isoleucyl-tRNA synthetase